MDKLLRWLKNIYTPAQYQTLFLSISVFFTSLLLLAMISIVLLIFARGGGYFWPETIYKGTFTSTEGRSQIAYAQSQSRFEQGNEDVRWLLYSHRRNPYGTQALVEESRIDELTAAPKVARISLTDGRVVLGKPIGIVTPEKANVSVVRLTTLQQQAAGVQASIQQIKDDHLAGIHKALSELDRRKVSPKAPARQRLINEFNKWQERLETFEQLRDKYVLAVTLADGYGFNIPLNDINAVIYPGQLNYWQKVGVAFSEVWTFLSEAPKQANTAGGVFPALFGTVLMVFIMTLIVTPFGVLAAVYLNEYAPNNGFTTAIRISVSNMAGVPSIVYGVFGLGFFIYGVGGSIDELFFADTLPAPTMGTPGVFWASLTMAILTLPVVIVATEEGLRNVPQGLKAGSYALGATKAETVMHTILPMASPGIMTGVILAIARAAGEVAPLMLVGAVKFAPNLPFDGDFPFLHLDRQFMHLGVLIYDGAFHSQTDAKGASMMFAACLLLLLVVFVLNILAVLLRARLRKRFQKG